MQLLQYEDDVLEQQLGGLPMTKLLRGLLRTEVNEIRSGAPREPRTLRHVWYSVVKPILSRIDRLHQQTAGGKAVKWPSKLSAQLSRLVAKGVTTYAELGIVDASRHRLVGTGAFPWVVLFIEKDTIYGELERLAKVYGVSAISGKGQPSFACTEHTIEAVLRLPTYDGQDFVLLSVTDYDPHGLHIADAQATQLQSAARGRFGVTHNRLGLVPSQLTEDERRQHAYVLKGADQLGFGEIGYELDALPLSRFRAIFVEGLEQYIDLDVAKEGLREKYLVSIAWGLLQPIIGTLTDAVGGTALDKHISTMEIPSDVFSQAVNEGASTVDPLAMDLFGVAAEVEELMREALYEHFGK